MEDLLGRMGRAGSGVCPGSAVSGIVANLSAFETPSLPHAFRALLEGEFLESYGVDFHGIWVRGSLGRGSTWGSEV